MGNSKSVKKKATKLQDQTMVRVAKKGVVEGRRQLQMEVEWGRQLQMEVEWGRRLQTLSHAQ